MTIKIEDVPIGLSVLGSVNFREFVVGVKKLKVGQSFFIATCPSNYRTAISALRYALNLRISVYKDGKGYRIGRTK